MSVGKRFEYQVRNAFRSKYPDAFVERQTDRMYAASASQGSPPDLLVNANHANYLIECKAVKGKSLAFNRLGSSQLEYLSRYESIGDRHSGFIAVLFYNGQLGARRMYCSWLVPIQYWIDYRDRRPRKSLAMKDLESQLGPYKMQWVKGEWVLPSFI